MNKILLVCNDIHDRDLLIQRGLPKTSGIDVVRFGASLVGRRYDLILVPFYCDDNHSATQKKSIQEWMLQLETRVSRDGRVVQL